MLRLVGRLIAAGVHECQHAILGICDVILYLMCWQRLLQDIAADVQLAPLCTIAMPLPALCSVAPLIDNQGCRLNDQKVIQSGMAASCPSWWKVTNTLCKSRYRVLPSQIKPLVSVLHHENI